MSPARRCLLSAVCAGLLVSQLGDLRKRADVVQMITGEIRPEPFYEDTYRTEDEMVVSGSRRQQQHTGPTPTAQHSLRARPHLPQQPEQRVLSPSSADRVETDT